MSHFTVMIIGEDIEKQLAPFHQFECTGSDDEFVVDVDVTEELRKDYLESKDTKLKDLGGKLHEPYDDKFYRDPTDDEKTKIGFGSGFGNGISYSSRDWGDGQGYRAKVKFIPEGWQEVEVPYSELMAFRDYAERDGKTILKPTESKTKEHKYGYCEIDEKGEVVRIVDRTNPNYKWDWWQVGGRWSGYFKLKPMSKGERGTPGVMGSMKNGGDEYCDSALIKDIDFDAMRNEAAQKARNEYIMLQSAFGGIIPKVEKTWQFLLTQEMSVDDRRAAYHDQPALKDLKAIRENKELMKNERLRDMLFMITLEDFSCSVDEYGERAARGAISSFAVLKDGKWYERGEMGWWGSVGDEKDREKWNQEFTNLLNDLSPETRLTIVDCHI